MPADELRIELSGSFGPLSAVEHLDGECGRIRYAVAGRRARGVFVVEPYPDGLEPVPALIRIQYGDGPSYRDVERSDRPVVNGVDLVGATVLDPDAPDAITRWRLNLRRPTSRYTSEDVPEKTAQHATAVIKALVERWCTHPDRDRLVLCAARRTASRRLKQLTDDTIKPLQATLAAHQAELRALEQAAERLRHLAVEHAALAMA